MNSGSGQSAQYKSQAAAIAKTATQSDASPNPVAANGTRIHEPLRYSNQVLSGGPACLARMRNPRYTNAEPNCPACAVRVS